MKADSEIAAEELIQLRGHHQSLKKTHQILRQQVQEYIQLSRQQEHLLSAMQPDVIALHPDPQSSGLVVASSDTVFQGNMLSQTLSIAPIGTQSTIPNLQIEALNISFPSDPLLLAPIVDPMLSISSTFSAPLPSLPNIGTVPFQCSTIPLASAPNGILTTHPPSLPGLFPVSSTAPEGWMMDGSSFRGLISDIFEETEHHTLSLSELFADDHEPITHSMKFNRY